MGYIYVCNRRVTHSENVAGTHNRCAWRPDSEGDPASAGARTPACRRACLRVCRYPARNLQTYSAFDPGGIGPGAPERSPTNLRAGSVRGKTMRQTIERLEEMERYWNEVLEAFKHYVEGKK